MPSDLLDGQLTVHTTADFSPGGWETLIILTAIACYNAVEVVILVLSTFRCWRGLYFWSLLVAAVFGVLPFSLGNALMILDQPRFHNLVFMAIGGSWILTIAHSLVLYSRLYLVVHNKCTLRAVFYTIIIDFLGLQTGNAVTMIGTYVKPGSRAPVISHVLRKVAFGLLVTQESLISALYIWETAKLLRLKPRRANRQIIWQLIGINVVIVLMSLVLFGLEGANYSSLETTLKGFFDSIKLKLELAILGRLVQVALAHRRPSVVENALSPISPEYSSSPTNSAAALNPRPVLSNRACGGERERGDEN